MVNGKDAIKRTTGKSLLRWHRRNSYYHKWLSMIYSSIVRPGSRVLHLGCECGDLLASVRPGYGVGIDTAPEAIELAQKRFGDLHFQVADPANLNLQEKFDYVLISDSLGKWQDIQQVFERALAVTDENTRIVITYYNYLWEGILRLGSLLKIRRPCSYQNWLPTEDIANLLELSNFDIIRTSSYLMLPKRIIPFTMLCNYVLSLLPLFRMLNLINLIVARPMPSAKRNEDLSVSVIVPCRNERGNIKDAIILPIKPYNIPSIINGKRIKLFVAPTRRIILISSF